MDRINYQKIISVSALIALTGFILSGPLGFLFVSLTKPQPSWDSPAVFARNYHIIQDLPYYLGFLLIGGMLMLIAAHYLSSTSENYIIRFCSLLSLCLATIFSALILFNYVCQIMFIRNLALNYKPEYDAAIEMFSMANPLSFCWSNEMFGYGILGMATWLMAGYYKGKNNSIRLTLIINGIMSVSGIILTIADVRWVLTTGGYIGYFTWNILMAVMMILIYQHSKKLSAA